MRGERGFDRALKWSRKGTVVQVVERSLPKPDICSLNLAIGENLFAVNCTLVFVFKLSGFWIQFESSHRQNVNCWYLKTRITEKEASSGPIFFLKKNRSKSDFLHSKARVWFHIFSRLTKPTFNLSNRLKIFFESSSSDYSFARAFHLIKIFG